MSERCFWCSKDGAVFGWRGWRDWYACPPCWEEWYAIAQCRSLAAALEGVCWGLAQDELSHNPSGLHSDPWEEQQVRRGRWSRDGLPFKYGWGAFDWLLEQARPPGCRAPWEVT